MEERQKEIKKNKILLYVKGTKDAPMCGFSSAVIQIFKGIGKPFATVDVLANPDIRQRMEEISNWPTFPQVFINGEFVGGCDIVTEMHERGELVSLVDKAFEAKNQ
ncbi:MAG: Grx4 family monothiol glutaredoxin [Candidatus Omnitrophica bacterium]|nr:Grx4 family monothiol glutaredoxin [Candidatus Omnitrophota bacterium]